MRPGQNKRMRGRNNNNNNSNRKGPNPLTRSYESNGPDVKIRGTAHHVGEKYLQLARDAQSSGDPVMAESYLQHAEHYFRLIASAQLAQQQSAYGYQRTPTEQAEADDEADDDFDSLPDRFASPAERVAPVPPQQTSAAQPYAERQPYNGGNASERPAYEQRAERAPNNSQQTQPDYQRPERQQNDRSYADRQNYDRQDRQQQDRQQQDRPQLDRPQQERQYDNRNGRDRGNYQERFQNNGQDRNNQDRQQTDRQQSDRSAQGVQDRGGQDRGSQDRGSQERSNQDRPARDYDNRGNRNNNRGAREFQPREARQPVADEAPANALPAFITAPVRIPAETAPEPAVPVTAPVTDQGDESGFLLRPRRRRRPKAEFAAGENEGHSEAPVTDSASE